MGTKFKRLTYIFSLLQKTKYKKSKETYNNSQNGSLCIHYVNVCILAMIWLTLLFHFESQLIPLLRCEFYGLSYCINCKVILS